MISNRQRTIALTTMAVAVIVPFATGPLVSSAQAQFHRETNPSTGNPHPSGEPTGNPHQFPNCSGDPHGQTLGFGGQCNGAQ